MRNILLASVLASMSSVTYAFNDFKCTIKDGVHLEDNGTLNHNSNIIAGYIGKKFVVNRQTGIITGTYITNSMSGTMPNVYDYLPEENSYKAVTYYKPNNTIDYLQINQYSRNKEKSFFFKDAFGTMVSGICTVI